MKKINRIMAFILSAVMMLGSVSVVSAANSYDYVAVENSDTTSKMSTWAAWYTNLNMPTYVEEGYVEEALLNALQSCQLNMNYYNNAGLLGTRRGIPYSLSNENGTIYSIEKMEIPDTDKTYYNPYKITVNTYFDEDGAGTWGFTYSIPVRTILYVNVIANSTVEKINATDSTDNIMVYPWDDFKLTAPTKVNYIVGESLDMTGYKLEVKVADKSQCYFPSCTRDSWDTSYHQLDDASTLQYISTSALPLRNNKFTKSGAYAINVKYTHTLDHTAEYDNPLLWNGKGYDNVEANFSKSINLAISQDYVTSIKITNAPDKTSYTEGETFNTDGMAVEAVHKNGSTEDITDDVTVDELPLALGQTEVYITYGNLYTTQAVTVSKKFVKKAVKAELTKAPDKTTYVAGETIDPTGAQVTLTYNDGTTQTLGYGDGSNFVLWEDYDEGTKITSSSKYLGAYVFGCDYETAFTVPLTVVKKEITSLSVQTPPNKTVYNEEESFNPDGLRLFAVYNDGTTGYFEFSDMDSLINAGFSGEQLNDSHTAIGEYIKNDLYSFTKYMRIYANSYQSDVYCDIPLNVNEIDLTGITVTAPSKTSYKQGDTLDTSGMTVTANYSDGTTYNATKYAKVSVSELNAAGKVTVYVVYGGYYGSFDVDVAEVIPDATVTGVQVTKMPNKTSYINGQNFNSEGMVVEAIYSDGTTKIVTDYDIAPVTLTSGNSEVVVMYNGYCTSVPVSVASKEMTAITISQQPNKTAYVEGEVFDDSGMLVQATYSDGSKEYLAPNEYSYSTSALKATDKSITVFAGDVSASVPITVESKAISKIKVVQAPDKISYIAGQSFDKSGMIVEAEYNDGTSAIITDYSVEPSIISASTELVTISKDGKYDTVKVSAQEKAVTHIAVTKSPDNTSYTEGDTFNTTGMAVTAYYNDGSSNVIADYTVSNPVLTKGINKVYITYSGLYTTVPVTVADKVTMTGIAISKQPNKTSYINGQNFNSEGMAVEAVYSDGTTKAIYNYDISPITLTTGTKEVIVMYDNYYTSVPVSVANKEMTAITIVQQSNKTSYVEGEVFDDSGMLVQATYSDGSKEYLAPNEYSYSTSALKATDKSITIFAGDVSASVPITVESKAISEIRIINAPNKIDYVVGQNFDSTGITVEALYNDGTSAIITDYTVEPSLISASTNEVTISKDGKSDKVKIAVSNKTVTRIAVTTAPNKTSYYAGQSFDSTGMTVTAYYNDGSSIEITDYNISNTILNEGTSVVYVTYNGLYTTTPVNVNPKVMTGISISKQPNKTSYIDGQLFDNTGLIVKASYSDGTSENIDYYNIDTTVMTKGQTKVYITYNDFFAVVPVSVIDKEIIEVNVITQPRKTSYVEGEVFDAADMELEVVYNDGSSRVLSSSEYSYTDAPFTVDTKNVAISVGSKEITIPVNVVEKEITSLEVTNTPDKITYVSGQSFDTTGMTVIAEYNDGTKAEIKDYAVTPSIVKADTSEVIISKGGKNDTVKISVSEKALVNIYISNPPTKTSYIENDVFDVDGLEVTGVYNDGTEIIINDYVTDNNLLTAGADKVYITYDGFYTTTPITVAAKTIIGIEIVEQPVKTAYVEGENFDDRGLIVKASYDDGSTAIITDYTYAPSVLSTDDSKVTITKDGFTQEVPVTVTDKVMTGIKVTKQPTKTQYTEGEIFDTDGMIVKAYFNDNTEVELSDYNYSTEPLVAGDKGIIIEYNGFTDTVPITLLLDNIGSYIAERNGDVNRDGSVTPVDAEILTKYLAGILQFADKAIHTGDVDGDGVLKSDDVTIINNYLKGKISFSDTVNADIDGDGYVTENDSSLINKAVLGMWSMDDVYNANADANDDGEINMLDVIWILNTHYKHTTIDYIEIVKEPDNTEYTEGDKFNPDGMEVEAVYKDGTREPITDFTYPEKELTPSDIEVEINFESHIAKQSVTVNEKSTTTTTEVESSSETTTEISTETTSETTTTSRKSHSSGGSSSHKINSETTTEVGTEVTSTDSKDNTSENSTNNTDSDTNNNSDNNNDTNSSKFIDVIGHWAEKYIEYLYEKGIVNGITDTMFMPDNSTKRGDFALVLYRMLDLKNGSVAFSDVPNDSYYAEAISACANADIFIGYGDGTFRPEQTITREEMMTVMAKVFSNSGLLNYNFDGTDYSALDKFTDGSSVSDWAKPYVCSLIEIGAIVGNDNTIRPQDDITRAEMSVIIYNYIANM